MAVNQYGIMSCLVSKEAGIEVKFEMKSTEVLLRDRGLQKNGPVQKLVDSECMRYMSPYMPRRQAGELEHMMVMATVVGSGQIDIPGPYAHYLYEGVLYVSPTTGSAWAKRMRLKFRPGRRLPMQGLPCGERSGLRG